MKKNLHLFDFDGTLTRHDSFTGFIRFVHGWKGLLAILLKASPEIIKWKAHLGGFALEAKLKMFSSAFKGMPHADFIMYGERYAPEIDSMLRPETHTALVKAAENNDRIAIVSASLGDWIRPWAAQNGVHQVIATEPETDEEGKLTGRFSTPNCTGEEKMRRIACEMPEVVANRNDYFITAYGDSRGDLSMLEFADCRHCFGKIKNKIFK